MHAIAFFSNLYKLRHMKLFTDTTLRRIDPKGVLRSVLLVPEQAEQAWKESRKVQLPARYRKAQHIVVAGMGGSLLGTHILDGLYQDRLKLPLTMVNGYSLPNSVDSTTLVLLSSYSGTTEEVLSCAKEARRRKAMRLGISLGGRLLQDLGRDRVPFYQIIETHNPSHQPRVGVGYSVFGQLGLLRSFFNVAPGEVPKAIEHARKIRRVWTETKSGIAHLKTTLRQFQGKQPVMVASEFLAGNAHVFSNQWNESGKLFSRYHILPELNHHLLEGLDAPRSIVKNSLFVFLESSLYRKENQKRMRLTEEIVQKQGARVLRLPMTGTTKLAQSLEALFISGIMTTAYAILKGVDPAKIEWVDYFKKRLAK